MVHFKKTTRMKIILTITTLLFGHFVYGQSNKFEIKYGLYGSYADPSWYQELTINENGSFLFYDRLELGTSNKYEGKWKIKKSNLILYDYIENNSHSPMPTIWKISENRLCNITKKHKRKGLCIELKM